MAAASGDLDEVKRLVLDCGVDPKIKDVVGETPLHYAASEGHPDVAKLLLEHGADPNAKDVEGNAPPLPALVHCLRCKETSNCKDDAACADCADAARVLLDHGADPTIRDNEGRTPSKSAANAKNSLRC